MCSQQNSIMCVKCGPKSASFQRCSFKGYQFESNWPKFESLLVCRVIASGDGIGSAGGIVVTESIHLTQDPTRCAISLSKSPDLDIPWCSLANDVP